MYITVLNKDLFMEEESGTCTGCLHNKPYQMVHLIHPHAYTQIDRHRHTHTLTHSLTHSVPHTHTHTQTHTHRHTHTHTISLSLSLTQEEAPHSQVCLETEAFASWC